MNKKDDFYKTILNLSKYHREHEKYYAQEPLEKSIKLQQTSIVIKTLADKWKHQNIDSPKKENPYLDYEDLNETKTIDRIFLSILNKKLLHNAPSTVMIFRKTKNLL